MIYFANPPWTAALLAPFGLLPLELSALLQIGLYFAILTGVIYKFGGSFKTVLIVFTSFMALDSAIELNVEWLVALGLLVPAALSGPLLLVKPQIALGYGLSTLASLHPQMVDIAVPWWAVVLGFGISASTGIIFGLLPAAKAALLNPIDALRHE